MKDKKISVIVVGAGGRIGQMLCREISASETMLLVGAIEKEGHPSTGCASATYSGTGPVVPIKSNWMDSIDQADVVIDFSTPESTMNTVANLTDHNKNHQKKPVGLVIGTTGLSAEQTQSIIKTMDWNFPCVMSANMSLGVNAIAAIVKTLSTALPSWDPEILEIHHNRKKDAPSGTAILLGKTIADGRNLSLDNVAVKSRDGITGARKPEEIGIQSLRGGDVAGEHTVYFFGDNERIEIHHKATDPIIFVRGALAAAKWIVNTQACGFYSMKDVLGL